MSFASALYGFYNSLWRQMGIIPSMNDALTQRYVNTALAAGTNNIDAFTVPTNTVWFVNYLCFYVVSSTITRVRIGVENAAVDHEFINAQEPISSYMYKCNPLVALEAGDIIEATIADATLNDDLNLFVFGYTFNVSD